MTSASVERSRRRLDVRWVLSTAFIIVGTAFVLWSMSVRIAGPGERPMDAEIIWEHSKLIAAGEPLYSPWPDFGPHYMTEAAPYPVGRTPYPPFLTVALKPLLPIGDLAFYKAWFFLLCISFWVYAVTLGKLAAGRISLRGTLGAASLLAFYPGTWAPFNTGNIDPVLWAMLGLGFAYPRVRGAGFMAHALIKLYGIWPFILGVRLEGRRVLLQGAAVLGVGVLVSSVILGPLAFLQASLDWFRWLLPTAGQGTWHHWNVSLSFAGLRVTEALGLWEYIEGPLPSIARLYLTIMGIAAPLATMLLSRGLKPRLRYSLVTCAAVLFSPLCWIGYTPLLYSPAAILLGLRRER